MNQVVIANQYQLVESLLGKREKSTVDGNLLINSYLRTIENVNTRKQYEKSISDWFSYWYGAEPLTLDMLVKSPFHATEYMQPYKDMIKEGTMKRSTYNAKVKGVKSFYYWFITNTTINERNIKLMETNPFESIKQESEFDKEGSSFLTPDELILMLNNPIGNGLHIKTRNQLLLEVAVSTAIRKTALTGLTVDEVKQIGDDMIISKLDKYNKMTDKPITDIYDRLIQWYEEDLKYRDKDNGTIFNMHPNTANNIVKEWVKSVGIKKKVTFHGLRATSGILVYHQSGDNKTHAQYWLQHTDGRTTDGYIKKENAINYDGQNAVKMLKEGCNFDQYVSELSREELIKICMSLDLNTKMKIIRGIKQGA